MKLPSLILAIYKGVKDNDGLLRIEYPLIEFGRLFLEDQQGRKAEKAKQSNQD